MLDRAARQARVHMKCKLRRDACALALLGLHICFLRGPERISIELSERDQKHT